MEAPKQDFSVKFAEMLKMYPNVPCDLVWLYVQQYSDDYEKCSEILNSLHSKYTNMQNTVIDDFLCVQDSPTSFVPEPTVICCNVIEANLTEPDSSNSSPSDTVNQNVSNNENDVQIELSSILGKMDEHFLIGHDASIDNCKNSNETVNFQEPLELHINVDDDSDYLHSWRPNVSNALCPDFFMPSLATQPFEINSNQVPSLDLQQNVSQVTTNSEGLDREYSNHALSRQMFHGYFSNKNPYEINFDNHLHFQKCQMNSIKYEVIKAKLELSDVKESVAKLNYELLEKSKIDDVQDIEKLNEDIAQLYLECQNLCSEVDLYIKDNALLGEIDEGCYTDQYEPAIVESEASSKTCDQDLKTDLESSDCYEGIELWPCAKCTFDNQPAVIVCEMCRSKRSSSKKTSHARSPREGHHHPKKGSLPTLS